MDGIRGRCLETKFQLQLILPLPFRLIVVVSLQCQASHSGIIVLTAFIPVARHIVLHKLQVAVAFIFPEIRFFYDYLHRLVFSNLRHRNTLFCHLHILLYHRLFNDVHAQRSCFFLFALCHLYQVRTVQVHVHQRLVNGTAHLIRVFRGYRQLTTSNRMIERQRSKKTIILPVLQIHSFCGTGA